MKERKGRRRLGPSPYRRPRVQWGSEYCQHLSVQKPRARESGRGREGEIQTRGGSANLGRSSEAPENIGHWPIFSLRRKEDLLCVKIVLLIQISSSVFFNNPSVQLKVFETAVFSLIWRVSSFNFKTFSKLGTFKSFKRSFVTFSNQYICKLCSSD